jgi:hypothetical protein
MWNVVATACFVLISLCFCIEFRATCKPRPAGEVSRVMRQSRIEELQRDTARPLADLIADAERVAVAEFDRAYGVMEIMGPTVPVSGGGGSPPYGGGGVVTSYGSTIVRHRGSPLTDLDVLRVRRSFFLKQARLRDRRTGLCQVAKDLCERAAGQCRDFTREEDRLWGLLTDDIRAVDARIAAVERVRALCAARERMTGRP